MTEDREGAFKVYVVREHVTVLVASCDDDSLGFTLLTLREEGQIDDDSRVGVRYAPCEGASWWLIDPFNDNPFSA